MHISNIKKLVFPLFAAAIFSACDKPETTDQLGTSGQNMVRVNTYGGVDANFSNSAIVLDLQSTDPVTIEFQLEYIGPKVFGNDLTLKVGVNDAARTAFNTTAVNTYDALPASNYTLNNTSATIKAGEVFSSTLSITILDPSLLDPAVSYMVPVSILSIEGGSDGVKPAPSTGTAYFHVIGNPLAGTYESTGYFYHPAFVLKIAK